MIDIVTGDLPTEYVKAALQATIVGVDIETSGLDSKKDAIACVQVYVPKFGTIMVRRLNHPSYFIHLMDSRRVTKIFQHAPFDLSFLFRDFPWMQPSKICDTKVAADILDPKYELFTHPIEKDKEGNLKKSHSLIALVHHYFGEILDKRLAVSNWFAEELSQEQLDYAAKDVEYLPALLKELEGAIFDKNPLLIHTLNKRYKELIPNAIAKLKAAA